MQSSFNLSISIVTHHSNLEIFKQTINDLKISLNKAVEQNKISKISLTILDNSCSEKYLKNLKIYLNKYWNINYQLTINVLEHNKGYGDAHNQVIRLLDSDYHIVLNPDVLLYNEAIIEAIDYMQKNKDVGLISPYAETELGEQLHLLKRYPPLGILFIRGFFPSVTRTWFKKQSEYYEMRDINQNKPNKDIAIASGCFMFFRSKDLKNKFIFSEKFFLYFEDFDLTWRFSNYSNIAYVPTVKIIHYGGDTAKKGIKHIFMFIRSAITFYNRYGWKLI
jgi:GT2 family glycosyltransferase